MTDTEYVEPTNEQLAKFLMVYSRNFPALQGLDLNEGVLRELMDHNPRFRAGALRHHKKFSEELAEVGKKIAKGGELQCDYIRPNGKQCPNFNEAGSLRCGLHPDEVLNAN